MSLPVYSKVYSNYQSDYISITDETFSEKERETVIMKAIDHEAMRLTKPYKFNFYRIADGIFNILKMTKTGLNSFMNFIVAKKVHSKQLTLHNYQFYNT